MAITNFVGKLQEFCMKQEFSQPFYEEMEEKTMDEKFKVLCKLGKHTSVGVGLSKKAAKHHAAQNMLNIVEARHNTDLKSEINHDINSLSKVERYSKKEQIRVTYIDKGKEENGHFEFQCVVKDFTGVGKGSSKKIAKEKAAEKVVEHFCINEKIEPLSTPKKKNTCTIKNPIVILHELCSKQNLQLRYEEECLESNSGYIVTCQVGELKATSKSISKKLAKAEVASLMCNLITGNTPETSPDKTSLNFDPSFEENPLPKLDHNGESNELPTKKIKSPMKPSFEENPLPEPDHNDETHEPPTKKTKSPTGTKSRPISRP